MSQDERDTSTHDLGAARTVGVGIVGIIVAVWLYFNGGEGSRLEGREWILVLAIGGLGVIAVLRGVLKLWR